MRKVLLPVLLCLLCISCSVFAADTSMEEIEEMSDDGFDMKIPLFEYGISIDETEENMAADFPEYSCKRSTYPGVDGQILNCAWVENMQMIYHAGFFYKNDGFYGLSYTLAAYDNEDYQFNAEMAVDSISKNIFGEDYKMDDSLKPLVKSVLPESSYQVGGIMQGSFIAVSGAENDDSQEAGSYVYMFFADFKTYFGLTDDEAVALEGGEQAEETGTLQGIGDKFDISDAE